MFNNLTRSERYELWKRLHDAERRCRLAGLAYKSGSGPALDVAWELEDLQADLVLSKW